MPENPFVDLHCRSDYSKLDGAGEIGQFTDAVVEQKMPAVAITDHGNLFSRRPVSIRLPSPSAGIPWTPGPYVSLRHGRTAQPTAPKYNG